MKEPSEIFSSPNAEQIFYNRANRNIMRLLRDLHSKLAAFSHLTSAYSMADLEQPHDSSGVHIDIMRRSSAWDENIKHLIRRSLSETISTLIQGILHLFEFSTRATLTDSHFLSETHYVCKPIFPNHPTPTRYEKIFVPYTFESTHRALLKIQELYRQYTSIEFLHNAIRSRDPSCAADHGNIERILTHDQSLTRICSDFLNLVARLLTWASQDVMQINRYIGLLEARINNYKIANHGKKDHQERVLNLEFLIRKIQESQRQNHLEQRDRCFLLLKEYVNEIKSGKDYTFGVSLRTLASSDACSLQKALRNAE